MAVSLTFLPLIAESWWCAHDIIRTNDDRDLHREIERLSLVDVPEPVKCFFAIRPDGEKEYGPVLTCAYDRRLKWVSAGELLKLKDHEAVIRDWRNAAAWAYLDKMPADWPVVLYWH